MILYTAHRSASARNNARNASLVISYTTSLKAHITQHYFENETHTCHLCNDKFETVKALQHHVDEERKMTVPRK